MLISALHCSHHLPSTRLPLAERASHGGGGGGGGGCSSQKGCKDDMYQPVKRATRVTHQPLVKRTTMVALISWNRERLGHNKLSYQVTSPSQLHADIWMAVQSALHELHSISIVLAATWNSTLLLILSDGGKGMVHRSYQLKSS